MIIGSDVIGIEFAQIFNRIGVEVTIIEMLPQILPNEDTEMTDKLEAILKEEEIEIFTHTEAKEIILKHYIKN